MKTNLFYLLIIFTFFSCDDINTKTDDLIGDWDFKRKVNSSIPSIPRIGSTTFEADNTGRGRSFNITPITVDFEWELINGEQQLEIAEANWEDPKDGMATYDLNRIDVDNFILERPNIVITLTRK